MFEWIQRMGTALNVGIQAAIATYKRGYLAPSGLGEVSPVFSTDWESYVARLFRYFHYDLYYFNSVFTELERYRVMHRRQEGLYKYTRPIYNPIFRLVNITAAKCYGGSLDMETLQEGAVPMMGLDRRTEAAIRQLWKWSNFGQMKMRYARYTARYGDGVLKVVDQPDKGRVRLEVLHPGIVKEADLDAVGYAKRVVIEYEREDPLAEGELCLYREVIDQERFQTFRVKNGQAELYGWTNDASGTPVPEWDNTYGFVPVVFVQAADIGRRWGAVTFHGGTTAKIDTLNDLASLVVDHMRQTVDAMWYMAGVNSVEELRQDEVTRDEDEDDADIADEERSTVPVLTGPEGSQPYPMVANVNFTSALEAVESILHEIEQDLPELAFARLREFQLHSAPALRTSLSDALDRLAEYNGNLDIGLIRAMQMACTIGGLGGYENFEPFGLEDYARGNLDFEIRERDLILDKLTKKERLEMFSATEAPPRWIWAELGKSEKEIIEAETESARQSREVAAEVALALAAASRNGGQPVPEPEPGEEDDE